MTVEDVLRYNSFLKCFACRVF